ncbi:hypothetical protein RHCRD62_50087 [Rhodococcus sp. RD6.2]|nr:hypothetical protein RHCRD62_50087 [Rhodococcus sp. RD6.2]
MTWAISSDRLVVEVRTRRKCPGGIVIYVIVVPVQREAERCASGIRKVRLPTNRCNTGRLGTLVATIVARRAEYGRDETLSGHPAGDLQPPADPAGAAAPW